MNSDYLDNLSALVKGNCLRDFRLTNNFDERYLEFFPKVRSEDIKNWAMSYPFGVKECLEKRLCRKFGAKKVVLGAGSEDLIVKCNQIIRGKRWKTGIVLPSFYRIWESLGVEDWVKLSGENWFANLEGLDVVWLTNPNSVTGEVINRESLLGIIKKHREILFIVDEAAMFLLPDWKKKTLLPHTRSEANLMTISSFSKMYGLSGMRVGFASKNDKFMSEMANFQSTFPLPIIVGKFLESVLDKEKLICAIRGNIFKNKKEVEKFLSKHPEIEIRPSVTNCMFLRCKDKPKKLYEELLSVGIIGLDLNTQLGVKKEGWVRITVHSSETKQHYLLAKLKEIFDTKGQAKLVS